MTEQKNATKMPAIFLAHGAPPLLDNATWMAELRQWALNMPTPKAILMLSAHWENTPLTLGATRTVPLVYDFYGFPQKYYDVTYPAPGAPALAERVRLLVGQVKEDPARGLDHGAYVPLVAMYPKADIPVLQVSLPSLEAKNLLALGRTLAPLRDEGVLLVGSGFLTHNLRMIRWDNQGAPPAWASEFDAWAAEVLSKRDADRMLDYRRTAPGVNMALPTHEHFAPVIAVLGSSLDTTEQASFPIRGFEWVSFSKRSVQFGLTRMSP